MALSGPVWNLRIRPRCFTLIELLLVLVILSLVLGLSLPNFKRTHEEISIRGSADTLVYTMRYARSRSVADNVVVKLIIEQDSFQLIDVPGRMGRRVALPSGVHFNEAPTQVLFYPDGQMDAVRFLLAGKKTVFIISTREIPGHVVLLEEEPSAEK